MSITAKELARILGLSQTAVSMALNNKPGVSTETRKEVIRAAETYGYDLSKHQKDLKKAGAVYENFSILGIGAAITVTIVILVPNGIDSIIHILVLLVVLLLILIHQFRLYQKALKPIEPEAPAVAEEQAAENTQEDAGDGQDLAEKP